MRPSKKNRAAERENSNQYSYSSIICESYREFCSFAASYSDCDSICQSPPTPTGSPSSSPSTSTEVSQLNADCDAYSLDSTEVALDALSLIFTAATLIPCYPACTNPAALTAEKVCDGLTIVSDTSTITADAVLFAKYRSVSGSDIASYILDGPAVVLDGAALFSSYVAKPMGWDSMTMSDKSQQKIACVTLALDLATMASLQVLI